MLAKDLIHADISPLKPTDTGIFALGLMDDFKLAHLAVVEDGKLLAVVSDQQIYELDQAEARLKTLKFAVERPYIRQNQHFYDVLRIMHAAQLSLLPVLDDKDNYLGSITLSGVLEGIARSAVVQQPGGILVLEVNNQDYSLAEISRLVESNEAKILSAYITSFSDSTRLEVTLKINRIDLSAIIQTFNRYDYLIIASFAEESLLDELLHDRYDSLMNYLNV